MIERSKYIFDCIFSDNKIKKDVKKNEKIERIFLINFKNYFKYLRVLISFESSFKFFVFLLNDALIFEFK